jgi:iron-sulfur cluster repair protein YtfE (RIC family)
VKTRGRLFSELKAELQLHTSLEEQHLFPILRRNPETKGLVAEAVKDNKELRSKLGELDALPKDDETFYERLKELQKSFRQHARDEKRELLPAVQRALSDEQVQGIVEKIEASVAEAEQAKQDELEERRAKARQEREQQEAAQHLQEEASSLSDWVHQLHCEGGWRPSIEAAGAPFAKLCCSTMTRNSQMCREWLTASTNLDAAALYPLKQ